MHNTIKFIRAGLTAFAILSAGFCSAQSSFLNAGDPAPELRVAKWVKGSPISKFQLGNVYVVELWATWCRPCRDAIPHLTEMAKKYNGKVSFIGVSIHEHPKQGEPYESTLPKVESFVASMGDQMDYSVAADRNDQYMYEAWMTASVEQGIPCAFVIDQKGRIAWIGHPMSNLDQVIGQVLDRSWDSKRFAGERGKRKTLAIATAAAIAPINAAMSAGDYVKAIQEVDAAVTKNPSLEPQLVTYKLQALANIDTAKAIEYATETIASFGDKDYQSFLFAAGQRFAMMDDLSKDAYLFSVSCFEAFLKKDPDFPLALNYLGLAYFKAGNTAKAIEFGQKAVDCAKANKYSESVLQPFEDNLKRYKANN